MTTIKRGWNWQCCRVALCWMAWFHKKSEDSLGINKGKTNIVTKSFKTKSILNILHCKITKNNNKKYFRGLPHSTYQWHQMIGWAKNVEFLSLRNQSWERLIHPSSHGSEWQILCTLKPCFSLRSHPINILNNWLNSTEPTFTECIYKAAF